MKDLLALDITALHACQLLTMLWIIRQLRQHDASANLLTPSTTVANFALAV